MTPVKQSDGQVVDTDTGRTVCPGVVCRCEDDAVTFCPMHGQKVYEPYTWKTGRKLRRQPTNGGQS